VVGSLTVLENHQRLASFRYASIRTPLWGQILASPVHDGFPPDLEALQSVGRSRSLGAAMHQCAVAKDRALRTLIAVDFLSRLSPSAFRQLETFASALLLLAVRYHRFQATSSPVLGSERLAL
jgi:hypothetical protein